MTNRDHLAAAEAAGAGGVTQIQRGMPVYRSDGAEIGALEDIDLNGLYVAGYLVPMEAVDRITPAAVFLRSDVVFPGQDGGASGVSGAEAAASAPGSAGGAGGAGGGVRVPIIEERLRVEKRPTQGQVEIRKRVERTEEVVRERLRRDEVEVQRVPVNRELDAPIGQRMEGEWLVVPVLEEVLVVQKRLVLKEEIRIRTRNAEHEQEIREELRRERVEVTPAGDTPTAHVVETSG